MYSNSTSLLFLENIMKTILKCTKHKITKKSDFLQNDKSSLFTALELVWESYLLFYSTPQLIQKFQGCGEIPWKQGAN